MHGKCRILTAGLPGKSIFSPNNSLEEYSIVSFDSFFFKSFLLKYAVVKTLPAKARYIRDLGSIPVSGRSPGVGNGNPPSVFLPGKFHGQRCLAVSESDTTEHPCTTHGKIHISQGYTLDSHKLNIHMYSTHRKKAKKKKQGLPLWSSG